MRRLGAGWTRRSRAWQRARGGLAAAAAVRGCPRRMLRPRRCSAALRALEKRMGIAKGWALRRPAAQTAPPRAPRQQHSRARLQRSRRRVAAEVHAAACSAGCDTTLPGSCASWRRARRSTSRGEAAGVVSCDGWRLCSKAPLALAPLHMPSSRMASPACTAHACACLPPVCFASSVAVRPNPNKQACVPRVPYPLPRPRAASRCGSA